MRHVSAPFVGSEALADLVYENEWEHRFLHIVRRQDIVSRLLIAKPESECHLQPFTSNHAAMFSWISPSDFYASA